MGLVSVFGTPLNDMFLNKFQKLLKYVSLKISTFVYKKILLVNIVGVGG